MSVRIHHADMLEWLAAYDGPLFDACVTDPPYHLSSIVKRFGAGNASAAKVGAAANHTGAYARASRGFMGQQWDGGDVAFRPETWAMVFDKLKPGAHLVAFSGTRTYHRMACAIEDAGFEIRDQLAWAYGSGFPKSHDVSKGIDKARDDRSAILAVTTFVAIAAEKSAVSRSDIDRYMGTSDMAGWWTSRSVNRCQCPSWEQWLKLKAFIGFDDDMDSEVRRLNSRKGEPGEAWSERDFYEIPTGGLHGGTGDTVGRFTGRQAKPDGVLDAAKRWQGWGTALKPAWEPICLARKPLTGSVAANVLAHGTGALNIDGCRVAGGAGGSREGEDSAARRYADKGSTNFAVTPGPRGGDAKGRWPANVLHDGSDEVLAAFPDAPGQQYAVRGTEPSSPFANVYGDMPNRAGSAVPRGDAGSAARFFYSAKAGPLDRIGSKHATVKPVDLMRWLCRLITPPGGLILEPFAGSGTTGIAAMAEGFGCEMVELEADHFADIERKLTYLRGEGAVSFVEHDRRRDERKGSLDLGPLFEGTAA